MEGIRRCGNRQVCTLSRTRQWVQRIGENVCRVQSLCAEACNGSGRACEEMQRRENSVWCGVQGRVNVC